MILPPPPAEIRATGLMARVLRAPFEPRTWRETFHLLFNLPVGIATFTILVTGFATGLGMLITLLGIPIIVATMYVSRWMASLERGRAKLFLDADVRPAYRPDPPRDKWWRVHLARFTDPATWVEVGYHLLMLPLGIITFTLAVTMWATTLGMLTAPVWAWATPDQRVQIEGFDRVWLLHAGPLEIALVTLGGLVLLFVTPWIVRALAAGNRAVVRGMLGTTLERRVQTLTETRTAAVDLAAEDRRRIERDLHDGVQQRLVALAMDLGRAKDKMDSDPDRAKELVTDAHEEAKRAITEVRDLARGIHPAVLTDRGLDAALSALAARSTVPVTIAVDVAPRPPASVEAAAYFVVSEALANVAKHARATAAAVTVRRGDDHLTVQVQDDGVGGATLVEGSGLAGLRDRVQALDGELHLLSPEGGPTVLMVEIPCVS